MKKVENLRDCMVYEGNPPLSPFFKGGILISSLYKKEGGRDFQAFVKRLNG
jgi:hypothetical protein